nr:MarR family transcriptional regulator [uncultured Mediterraneibacter sp.]
MRCDLNNLPTLGMMGIVMHKVMNRARGMYQEFDLNKSQASILFTLHQRDSMSQKELASRLNVTAPSITSAIQKMEKENYLTRRPDEKDQRVMRLSLTEKGKSCVRGVRTVAEEMENLMFQGMNAEEVLLLRRFMIQIYDNLREE